MKSRILIVDDELIVSEDLRDLLEGLGYDVVGTAATGRAAVAEALASRPDLVLMDVKLKDEIDGIDAARSIRERLAVPVVFLTAFADEATIARAAAVGPYGYLTKPFNDRAIRATIEVALHRHREEMRPAPQDPGPGDADDMFHGLVGGSAPMRLLFEQIAQVAQVNTTVFIEGETGTGKERVARAIHDAGPRAGKPFIAVNCAGLTETLTATELFGHRRGAFTGALNDHKGHFEAAEGGTLFLDEIGDVTRNQQPFLLRVLEEREITRVGESTPRRVDVRVIAASNRPLEPDVAAGRFRSDLFYRIRIARITVPPLRARSCDVPLLVRHFFARLKRHDHVRAAGVSDETMKVLSACAWPGNVRELKNAIEYAAIRCLGDVLQPGDLPPELQAAAGANGAPPSPDEERPRLLAALAAAGGNRTEAARLLGISRATFYRRLAEPEARRNGTPDSRRTSDETDPPVS